MRSIGELGVVVGKVVGVQLDWLGRDGKLKELVLRVGANLHRLGAIATYLVRYRLLRPFPANDHGEHSLDRTLGETVDRLRVTLLLVDNLYMRRSSLSLPLPA